MEGGGSSSSGRTIHGAAVILGTHPTNHQQQQQVDYIHLYISRPQGKFWLLDLGTPDQPVKTLTPTLLPRPLSLDSETVPPPSLGGRLFPLPPLRREGDGRRRRWMLSWTPLGALYVLAMEAGGDDVDEGEEEEREDDGSRAVCLWSRGLHSLAVRYYFECYRRTLFQTCLAKHAWPLVGSHAMQVSFHNHRMHARTHMHAAPRRRRRRAVRRRTPRPPARPRQGHRNARARAS